MRTRIGELVKGTSSCEFTKQPSPDASSYAMTRPRHVVCDQNHKYAMSLRFYLTFYPSAPIKMSRKYGEGRKYQDNGRTWGQFRLSAISYCRKVPCREVTHSRTAAVMLEGVLSCEWKMGSLAGISSDFLRGGPRT